MSTPAAVDVRVETSSDAAGVADVVLQAFGRESVPELVELIRSSPNYVPDLALVAVRGERLVGHTMLSYVDLVDGDARHRVLTLSPLSVVPDSQRRGIGSVLVTAAIEKADRRREPLIMLEGHPNYYTRFGFRPSREFGISVPLPDWAPEEAGMVRPLDAYEPSVRGALVYPPAFDVVAADGPRG
jgi:putative acetyltransferase